MTLTRLADADDFVHINLKPEAYQSWNLPVASFPVRTAVLTASIEQGGIYTVADLIRGLMDWQDVTDDIATTAMLLRDIINRHYPNDGLVHATCGFEDEAGVPRRVLVDLIDCDKPLVVWQREGLVFAVGQASSVEQGRLAIGAPHPISLRTAKSIMAHSMILYMGEPFDSFAGVQSSADRTVAFYNLNDGKTEVVRWDFGYGVVASGRDKGIAATTPRLAEPHSWLTTNQLAIMVAIGAGYDAWRIA